MKTLIKLVIAGLLVHACWKGGTAYWRFYMFKDGVQAAVLFAGGRSEADIRKRVIEIAKELEIPVDPETVEVRREEYHTFVNTAYTERIELVPTYFYPRQFTVNVDVFTVK